MGDRPLRAFYGSLTIANFRWLLSGQLLSTVGDQFYAVALPYYLLSHAGGIQTLALALAAFGVARALSVNAGGVLVDRWGALNVMRLADLGRMFGLAALCGLALYRPLPPVFGLLAIATFLGLGAGLFNPGHFSVMPRIIPRESLQSANATFQGGLQATSIVAPSLGGLIMTLSSAGAAFGIDAATFLFSVISLSFIRISIPPGSSPSHSDALPSRQQTFREIWNHYPLLRMALVSAIIMSLAFGGVLEVALPSLAHNVLQVGASGYGVLISAYYLGALGGTIVAGRWGNSRTGIKVLISLAIQGVLWASVFFSLNFPTSPAYVATIVLIASAGMANGLGNTWLLTIFQRALPTSIMGRAMGLMLLANYGLYPVSVMVAGATIAYVGTPLYFLIAGVVLILGVIPPVLHGPFRAMALDTQSSFSTEFDTSRSYTTKNSP